MTHKLFRVESHEVWIQKTYVLAQASQEAITLVREGGGVQDEGGSGFEYSRTLDRAIAYEVQDERAIKFFTHLLQDIGG